MRSFYAMPAASHKEMLTHNYIVFTNERPIVRIYVCFSGTSLSCNSPTLSSSSSLYVFLVYLCPIMPLESLKAIAAAVSLVYGTNGELGLERSGSVHTYMGTRVCVFIHRSRWERHLLCEMSRFCEFVFCKWSHNWLLITRWMYIFTLTKCSEWFYYAFKAPFRLLILGGLRIKYRCKDVD